MVVTKMIDNTEIKKVDPYYANCMNCGSRYLVEYGPTGSPISLWCKNCRVEEGKIKMKFKKKVGENKEDPFLVLAKMKIILDKATVMGGSSHSYVDGHWLNDSDMALHLMKQTINKVKIPKKYLIAESL